MRWRLLLVAVVAWGVGTSCGRSGAGKDTDNGGDPVPAVEDRAPEEKAFGRNPLALQPDPVPGALAPPTSTPPATLTPPANATSTPFATLMVTPPDAPASPVSLPAVRLQLASDGAAMLDADAPAAQATLHLAFAPITDKPLVGSAWQHASYRFQLTDLDEQTTDGLYPAADPERQLRPADLQIDLTRVSATQAKVRLSGALIPAQAENLGTAPRYLISGEFTATIEQARP